MQPDRISSPAFARAVYRLALLMLEILHRSFLGFCCAPGGKGSEIPPFPRLGIFLAGVQAVFAGFQFSNHREILAVKNPSSTQLLVVLLLV
jgi:hypothetical protein